MPCRPASPASSGSPWRSSGLLLLALLALAAPTHVRPAQAQGANGQPENSQPWSTPAEGPLPAPPAAAAPQPPDLTRPPRAAESMPQPAIALPRGMESLAEGGWRLSGPAARGTPDPATRAALAEIGRWLGSRTEGRVTLLSQVAGPAEDPSMARRDSLANGLALRRILEEAGLDGTRIDTRPLGRTGEARDSIVLLPPSANRQTQTQTQTPSQSQARP